MATGAVTFTVKDAAGHPVTATVNVTVNSVAPVANGTLDKTSINAGDTVRLTQTCQNADWYQINWGAGETLGSIHVLSDTWVDHTYANAGTYTIDLHAWQGTQTTPTADAHKTFSVTVAAAPPTGGNVGKLYGGISLPLAQTPDQFIDRISADGFGWYRFDLRIATVSPSRGTFNWSSYDPIFDHAAAQGLQVNAICYMLPQWMNGSTNDKTKPTNPQDYADWCGTAAPHLYAHGVRSMELWNEQNWGFWLPTPNRQDYCTMAILAADAIHNAEPRMLVVSGGLSTADTQYQAGQFSLRHPVRWLRERKATRQAGFSSTYPGCHCTLDVYGSLGLFSHIDAVGIHPYLDGVDPTPTGGSNWCEWSGVSLRTTIAIIDKWAPGGKNAAGKTIKVWNTESACPRSTTSESIQATRAGHAYQAFSLNTWTLADGVTPMRTRLGPYFWFTYMDWIPGQPAREASFGLVNTSFVPHAALGAVKTELAKSVTVT